MSGPDDEDQARGQARTRARTFGPTPIGRLLTSPGRGSLLENPYSRHNLRPPYLDPVFKEFTRFELTRAGRPVPAGRILNAQPVSARLKIKRFHLAEKLSAASNRQFAGRQVNVGLNNMLSLIVRRMRRRPFEQLKHDRHVVVASRPDCDEMALTAYPPRLRILSPRVLDVAWVSLGILDVELKIVGVGLEHPHSPLLAHS